MTDSKVPPWKMWSTAFKLKEAGPTYYDFTPGRIVVMRANPVRVWQKQQSGTDARWLSLRDPAIDIAELIRQVRLEDALGTENATQPPTTPASLKMGTYHVRRRANFRAFLAYVPKEVQDLVIDGWGGPTWPYFRLLMTSPAAREIAQTPEGATFVFALSRAHDVEVVRDPKRKQGRWLAQRLREKRKTALGHMGFPAAPSTLTAMCKVPRADFHGQTLVLLRNALSRPDAAKRCFHAERLSPTFLNVLDPALLPHVSPQLLASLEHHDWAYARGAGFDRLIFDAVAMAREHHQRMPLLTSEAHVREVHDELLAYAAKHNDGPRGPLAPLPIEQGPEEQSIVQHLSTSESLVQEGLVMHHCLGRIRTHHELAREGRFFAFALLAPVRASLAVWRPDGEKQWTVYDVKGPWNAPPHPEHVELARTLLQRFQGVPVAYEADESVPF